MTTTQERPAVNRTHQISAVRQFNYPCSERTHALIGSRLPAGRKPTNPELVALLTQLLDEQLNPGRVVMTNVEAAEPAARPTTVTRQAVYDAYLQGVNLHGWCGVAARCLLDMGIDVYRAGDNGYLEGEISRDLVRSVAMRYARDNSQSGNVRSLLADHLGIR
jgi:hypothetical protein